MRLRSRVSAWKPARPASALVRLAVGPVRQRQSGPRPVTSRALRVPRSGQTAREITRKTHRLGSACVAVRFDPKGAAAGASPGGQGLDATGKSKERPTAAARCVQIGTRDGALWRLCGPTIRLG